MYIVYQISNKVNKKRYIGISGRSLEYRVAQHERTARSDKPSFVKYYLHRAIRKWGWDTFEVKLLESNVTTLNEAKRLERFYIDKYKTNISGYNLTPGGDHFMSSEWQRSNQLKRVAEGTHPFLGGTIQRATNLRRMADGTHNFIGGNQRRIQNGTHHFVGDKNPIKRLAKLGLQRNQTDPWLNTKTQSNPKAVYLWKIADQLYNWYLLNKHKPRGGSYKAMQYAFELETSAAIIVKKFKSGWNPTEDPKWLDWKSNSYSL